MGLLSKLELPRPPGGKAPAEAGPKPAAEPGSPGAAALASSLRT